ncbi:HAD family hydrolase [Microcoleus sp. FACHB-831]|uniref:HAD family hydrolase n=1 Tax=Microcoleus sp. FACHB-831 TaxID=2692827 RepID=UPI001683D091|nr:HAD family hydrolase [Microcoleus sp. FACHB-831]MBD1924157.1 HAD family hydrolase [Microcoleus sp. FACHB-831]
MSKTLRQSAQPVVAAFDFDGTLTRRDSFLPFLARAVGEFQLRRAMVVLSPMLMRFALGKIPNWQAKQTLITYLLRGWTEEKLNEVAQSFARENIPLLLRPEAVERLRWHQKQGHQLILISASLEAYLIPWAQTMGFTKVLATQLEIEDGVVTGRLLGKNCYGPEKVERLKGFLGDLSGYCLYAYGDTKGDRELIAAAKYGYYRTFEELVKPY